MYIFAYIELRSYWAKVHQIFTPCSQIITDELCKIGMPGLRIKVNSPILPILTLTLIVVAMSLQPSENRVRSVIYDQIPTTW